VNEPTVCAIMLTRDRPELAKKAVQCFRNQTYRNKRLTVYDTGDQIVPLSGDAGHSYILRGFNGRDTIGAMRNAANECAVQSWEPDIFVTFDDDDWNHPNRIAEQVALLQASGADVVGYNDMLFWRTPRGPVDVDPMERTMPALPGEAWLFHRASPSYALGTSLCYWRKTWERKPFPDMPRPGNMGGEDAKWIEGLNVRAASSLCAPDAVQPFPGQDYPRVYDDPRMIARIHGGNTSRAYETLTGPSWKRAVEWDERVRGIIE
jgi:Glycosyl transferase family 2